METENLDKTKEIELLQEAMRGMMVSVHFGLSKGEVLKIGMIAGGAGLLGIAAYSEIKGWFLKRKLKKQMDEFMD